MKSIFDDIKKINAYGQEYRLARSLAKALGYNDFGNFQNVIMKAKIACENSGQDVADHLGDVTEMVSIGLESEREFQSYQLSRYACYLIAMEADSRKKAVALAKTYFAIQTRKQEAVDQHLEDQKRLYMRDQLAQHNKSLAKTAKKAEVRNYGEFIDYGYLGLYGMKNKEILKAKGLDSNDKLLDHIGSEELAANLFRATQADAKIQRDRIIGQDKASNAHFEIGKQVRQTIQKIGGTVPEKLPVADNIQTLKKRSKKKQHIK